MARIINANSFAYAYESILNQIYYHPDNIVNPREEKTFEIENLIVEINDPTSNMFKNSVRSTPKKYLAGELMWYFGGMRDLKFISQYSNFWKDIANDWGVCNSAYGHLIFMDRNSHGYSEWDWARNSLINDKHTRQAIIRFNKPYHSYDGNKDFVCTLNGIFSIRKNKLNFTVMMRSNDVFYGMTYDYPFFMLLQQQMRLHLLKYYPDLELGKFTHIIKSAHIYERNFNTVENMINNGFEVDSTPIIRLNLIEPNGYRTEEFDELISSCVIKDFEMEETDPLYKWIYKYGRLHVEKT